MLAAEIAAAAINRRLSPEVKAGLAQHSGRFVALTLPGQRMVFGISQTGELQAASPVVQADAEITPFGADSGNNNDDADNKIQIAGDAKLLDALSMVWKECADIQGGLAKIIGDPLAADIKSAAKKVAAEGKTAISEHFVTKEELNAFKSKVRTFTTRRNK